MWIRTETQDDHAAIRDLLGTAFAEVPGNGRVEQRIVDTLREDGELSLCLVADIDGRLAGVAVFSPVAIEGAKSWYGLGPVAVAPRDQGHGVGTALIRAGLAELAEQGAAGCVVLGEPAYYARFGFLNDGELHYADAPPQYFQSLAFGDATAKGAVRYHRSFSDA
ncbi:MULTISPECIES: N-acetyltransferase [unclassified Lysobacter]|uniref:GNAT family N-acetyltransferase n=1 Tax=unclassified Lysobacter TaxID=2635362 RepID=UPI001C21D1C8|nr:N-acetyltransferase [Lysobacter sp. MMG2]MBU8977673.1 N-acetyltransferase [Lysobacter sp. MMG2]